MAFSGHNTINSRYLQSFLLCRSWVSWFFKLAWMQIWWCRVCWRGWESDRSRRWTDFICWHQWIRNSTGCGLESVEQRSIYWHETVISCVARSTSIKFNCITDQSQFGQRSFTYISVGIGKILVVSSSLSIQIFSLFYYSQQGSGINQKVQNLSSARSSIRQREAEKSQKGSILAREFKHRSASQHQDLSQYFQNSVVELQNLIQEAKQPSKENLVKNVALQQTLYV